MIRKEIIVKMKNSVNSRPAAMLVQAASQFDSEIFIETENRRMNAKSIMGMMALGLDNGEEVTIVCDGSDEDEAFDKIEQYLTNDVK